MFLAVPALTAWPPAHAADPAPVIKVTGLDAEVESNVRAHLDLGDEPCGTPLWLATRRMQRARADVDRALRAFGYYGAVVDIKVTEGDACWSGTVAVQPGPRTRVRAVNVDLRGEAQSDREFQRLLADLPLKPGDPLRHDRYESIKQALGSLAAERGFLEGRLEDGRLQVDPATAVADVYVRFESGPRYRIGEISIEQDVLAPEYVARFLPFKTGDPYSALRMAELHRAFADSGYFDQVEVRPAIDRAKDAVVPVDVRLTGRPRRSYGAGVGISTDTGPRVRLEYEDRRFSPDGERVTARAAASFVDTEVTASYRIPLDDPRTEWLSFETGYRLEDTDTSQSDALSLGVTRTHQRGGGWLETRSLELRRERFTIAGDERVSTLVIPGIGWARTRSNDTLYPTRGHRLGLDLRASPGVILSDVTFAQLHLTAKWVRSLPLGGRVIARGEVGFTEVDDFSALPASLRFFAGGDQSVRGYDFEALGPTDSAGQVIGGRHLLVGSLEYEHPVAERWGVATFVDAGNAINDFGDPLNVGVGAGVRWRSPIGPVRVDVAVPLDDEGTAFRLHLRIGPDL